MNLQSMANVHQDRRQYFRIDVPVQLQVKPCSSEDVESGSCTGLFKQNDSQALLDNLRGIDYEHSHLLRRIAENDRSLEAYLRAINKKIELLASHFCAEKNKEQSTTTISLSEAGMCFQTTDPLEPGDFVAAELILLPSYNGLYLFAEVISCIETEQIFKLGVRFINLSENDQQLLAKQVMQSQLLEKRKQHEG